MKELKTTFLARRILRNLGMSFSNLSLTKAMSICMQQRPTGEMDSAKLKESDLSVRAAKSKKIQPTNVCFWFQINFPFFGRVFVKTCEGVFQKVSRKHRGNALGAYTGSVQSQLQIALSTGQCQNCTTRQYVWGPFPFGFWGPSS